MTVKMAGIAAILIGMTASVAAAAECRITEDEILAAEARRYEAQTGNDFPALDRIYGDDMIYIHSTAAVDTKASYLGTLKAGTVRYRTMRLLDSKVRVYDCLAIMTGTARFDVTVKGEDITVDLRFTETWARRGNELQFISWQSTRVPPK
ncbi:MAG TPA: nuclear transport factor 2 family protein [Burkholderiales bacterium]|nr:nuclear transport factor 2 family protein [Burkholderiales bacterium]